MDSQSPSIGQIGAYSEQGIQQQQQQNSIQDSYNCIVQLQKDLQFIQLLSNPDYIIQLHMRGYLYDEKFQRYLQGLKYLNSNKYITLMKYPQGLFNLERIKSKGFAEYLKTPENVAKFRRFSLDRNQLIAKRRR